jgi:hypothetical protein
MHVRWVSHNSSPELPIVGQAKIASFWPGRFYFVSTVQHQLHSSSPLSKLTRDLRSLQPGASYNEVPLEQDMFITQIFRCNKHGWVKSFDDPLFEREYSSLSQARIGHNEAIDLLSKGKLKLSHQRKT